MEQFNGGCVCGKVRIVAHGPPHRTGICHCMDCRKHHGALFYAAAVFPMNAVEITGVTNSYAGRHFCPKCGSPVFAQSDDEVEIHLGALDDPDQLTPTYESWCQRREGWLPRFGQMRQYPQGRGNSGRSED